MIGRPVPRILLILLLLLPAGCGTIHIDAPEGKRVRLLDQDAAVSVETDRKVWFALWGAVDLSDTHTAAMIEEKGLTEARFHVRYTTWDAILNLFVSLLGFSQRSVIVEGNVTPRRDP